MCPWRPDSRWSARDRVEAAILLTVAGMYGYAVALILDGQRHASRFLSEGGAIENGTVVALVTGAAYSLVRGIRSWRKGDVRPLATGAILAVVLLFVTGEELNWGQNLIGFETGPGFFQTYNEQGEVSIHNLAFGWFSLNFYVFGPPLMAAAVAWAVGSARAFRKRPGFRRFARSWGLPVPRPRHVKLLVLLFAAEFGLGFLELVGAIAEGTQEHSEFAYCWLFFCILMNGSHIDPETSAPRSDDP